MEELEINGVLRDLSHLKNFVVSVPKKGRDNADLRVQIMLGVHTISKGCESHERDLDDENGKPRQFCEDRYAFSLGLPEMAKRMIIQNYFSWESKDRNSAIHYAIIDMAPGRVRDIEDGLHQVVFFYLYPCADPNVADVNLVITSCHAREINFGHIRRRYNMHTILRTCLFQQTRMPK